MSGVSTVTAPRAQGRWPHGVTGRGGGGNSGGYRF